MSIGFFETRAEKTKPKRKSTRNFGGSKKQLAIIDYSRFRELGCDDCPLLSDELNSPKMKPTGDKQPTIYILGEAPGADEDREGKQFVGRSGKLLRNELKKYLPEYCTIRWDNTCRCRPPKNRTPEREEIERCRNSIQASIERAKPKVLVAVGATALLWAIGENGIMKWRGKFIPIRIGSHTCWLYPILHPAFILRSGGDFGGEESGDWGMVFSLDIKRLASRISEGLGDPSPERLEDLESGLRYARDAQGLAKLDRQLTQWAESKAEIAFDIETDRLRPYSLQRPLEGLLAISFSDGNITWSVPVSHKESNWSPDDYENLQGIILRFLRSRCIKIAHNLPFEMEWLTSIFGHEPPWKRSGWGDTMTQAYYLDERRGGLGLDHLCMYRFGFPLKVQSDVDRKNLASLAIDKLLTYNALDSKYTARLYQVQKAELEREGLWAAYKGQLSRCLTLVKAQQKGLVVDIPVVEKFQRKLEKEIAECKQEISNSKDAKLYQKKTGEEFSPMSPDQVAVLFRDILGRPEGQTRKNKSGYSVDEKVLGAIKLPIAKAILQLRKKIKLKSTYIDGCAPGGKQVYPDGKLHTKFNDLFTVTGRLSSEEPNVQNFPMREHPWIRAIVTTPKTDSRTGKPRDYIMVSADYGQIEPRVIAMASGDKRLGKLLKERYDIHGDWAERIAAIDPRALKAHGDMKGLRQDVKSNWVLAGFYGAMWENIQARLHLSGACAELFDEFKSEFPGVWAWQDQQVKLYKKYGYVCCLTGRRRHAPLSMNQLLNNTTQGTASDIVVDAMTRLSIRAERENEPVYQSMLNIHDDLEFYVPKKKQDIIIPEIVWDMLTPKFEWVTVPLSVEVKAGPNWADMEKIGTFFSDELP
jgi:uracil-DNA glycosylase family 4